MAGVSTFVAGCNSNSGQTDGSETTDTDTATTTGEPTTTSTTTETEPVVTPPDEPPRSASQIDPNDGFAEMAPWVDGEDVEIRRVTESDLNLPDFTRKVIGTKPRVVVFETSGTVDLGGRAFTIGNDNLWIAGQTAPSPGITLTHGTLKIEANNCVIQHIRVRPGDGADATPGSTDAIFIQDGFENNVVDHCSASWSMDEALSVGFQTNNNTVTNCLVAEPLDDSLHPKGPHGYNSLIGDNSKNVTLAGNVWANSTDRNPRLKEGNESVVANNFIHHYYDGCVMGDPDGQPITSASVVGNVYQQPQTGLPAIRAFGDNPAEVYLEDNIVKGGVSTAGGALKKLDERPLWPDDLTAMDAADVPSHNLANAGARPADRSEHDVRIVNMIKNGEGHVIDSQEEVGGYPELERNTRPLTVPDSNLRAWLRQHALEVEQ
ncbi:hypothetical protein [Haloarchaeobius sp. DYHT-AS-18]|uniref:hypothetical protein n=1 Tax=Haloarchaeobius sp. DYHT-AS-18 TaxID=3446117 RepID=UPI003EBE3A73